MRRLFALLPLLAACSSAPPKLPPTAPSPLLEKPLPAFERPTLGGERVATQSYAGRPVVVKFFAEYCKPCQRTLPAAERLHREHPDVAFIGVSEDERESTARGVVQKHGLTFPVVLDRGNVLAGRFRVSEMPVTFVVDRRGFVRWVGSADQTEADFEQAVGAVSSAR
ncbi:MAG: TlpA family protein disulfide reductase [Myxococcales bacterium]|nr:TlpA family protein disulfide reductase [Myxococcales bacterium]MCB9575984.1 TlpA family protein disulfide reductase [Polyangiaceae bacterium]